MTDHAPASDLTPDDAPTAAPEPASATTVAYIDELAARAAGAQPSFLGLDDPPPAAATVDDARRLLDEAWIHSDAGTAVPPDARLRQVKKAALLAMRPVTSHQVQFNQQLSVAVKELAAAMDGLAGRVGTAEGSVGAATTRVHAALATVEVTVDDLAAGMARLEGLVENLAARTAQLEGELSAERAEIRVLRARQDVVLRTALGPLSGKAEKRRLAELAGELDHSAELLAEDLMDATRGTRDEVRAEAVSFLDTVLAAGGGPVVDLGFGRGEWIEVLAERGIDSFGVDQSQRAVAAAVKRGLDVARADAVGHLAGLAESSIGAVTAFHLVDRLGADALLELLDQALRVLRPGGVLILSAANPTALDVGAADVWLDPARRRPMHPELLELVVLARGFGETEVQWLDPTDESRLVYPDDLAGLAPHRAEAIARRFNQILAGPRSFAVVARKAGAADPLRRVTGTERIRPRRLAILKPDFGVTGGFERVVDHVEASLRRDGHDVTRLTVAVDDLVHKPYGLAVPDDEWQRVPEYFRYVASIEAFSRLDTRRFDAVVSTQPPSFANRHPRHLAVFFHHHRIFYDLEAAYLAAGLAADPAAHAIAAVRVRDLDRPLLANVGWFLAGSESVRNRLARFNHVDRVGLFTAGVGVSTSAAVAGATAAPGGGPVLCVGRHEFPKRTELFVLAMKHLPERRGASVGTGGREPWARALDHRLSQPGADLDGLDDAELWCNTGQGAPAVPDSYPSNVEFLGRVDDPTLDRLYREAPCVVAPAFAEDYGLTAVEAMSHGTPAIVCRDGGGLADLVDHEVDGLVVDPTGAAIAHAIDRICRDPSLRAALSEGARAKAATITWANADRQLRAGLAEGPRMNATPPWFSVRSWSSCNHERAENQGSRAFRSSVVVLRPRTTGKPGWGERRGGLRVKVGIVAPSPVPFTRGGAERAWSGLQQAIDRETAHQCEVVKLPVREDTLPHLIEGYQAFADLDVSHFDVLITSKYPAWITRHPRHVVWMFHPLRGLYDTYHVFNLPEFADSQVFEVRELLRFLLQPPKREHLDELLDRWKIALDAVGPGHPDVALPSPVGRAVVQWLDRVALSPAEIHRHLALSRTIANRPGYFPDGVDPGIVYAPSDLASVMGTGSDHLFTASRLDGPKRIDLLIRAMVEVPGDLPLLIGGTGPRREELEDLAARDPRIRFLGFVSDDDLPGLYADAVAVPFVPADEDYGLITVEAMACGRPVVTCTDSGGPTELVIDGLNGLVAPPTPAALGAAISRLVRDPALADHLGASARREAAGISWANAIATMLDEPVRSQPATDRSADGGARRGDDVEGRSVPGLVDPRHAGSSPAAVAGRRRASDPLGGPSIAADAEQPAPRAAPSSVGAARPRPHATVSREMAATSRRVASSDRAATAAPPAAPAPTTPARQLPVVNRRSFAAAAARPKVVALTTFGIAHPHHGGQLRARHLYGALARHVDVDVVALVEPGAHEGVRPVTPGLREIAVARSASHHRAGGRISGQAGMAVTDIVAGTHVAESPAYLAHLRDALRGASVVLLAEPYLLPAIEALGNGLPRLYDAYNVETDLKSTSLPGTAVGRDLLEAVVAVEGRAVRTAAAVTTCSAEDAKRLSLANHRSLHDFTVIPNGTDCAAVRVPDPAARRRSSAEWRQHWAELRADGPPREALAVFFASWHPPNLDAAEILMWLAAQLPEVQFVLGGSHGDAFADRPTPDNLVFTGVITEQAKRTLLAAADIALNPMMQGSGTNLKVIEYLAAGVPVVSTGFGVRGLNVVDGEHLLVAEPHELADAVRRVLADPAATAARAAAGRTLALAEYDWQALGNRLAAVVRAIR